MAKIELVYCPTEQACLSIKLDLEDGATIAHALQASGWQAKRPEISALPVGIFSKRVTKDTVLNQGDRVEIYRPLLIDPKQKRRERAKKKIIK